MTSTNMFAYCGNNLVNRYDHNGEAFLTATICGIAVWKIAAAFIGALFVGAATYAVTDSYNPVWTHKAMKKGAF